MKQNPKNNCLDFIIGLIKNSLLYWIEIPLLRYIAIYIIAKLGFGCIISIKINQSEQKGDWIILSSSIFLARVLSFVEDPHVLFRRHKLHEQTHTSVQLLLLVQERDFLR